MSAIFPPAVPRTNAATTPNAAQEPPKQMFRNSTAGPLLLRRAQEVGTLIRVGRDTYIEPHDAELPQWDRVRAEVLARCATLQRRSGDSFVVSHMTAALIHGLWVPTSTTVHVTQPHSRTSTPWSFDPVVRHRRELRPEEVTMVGGIRVTSLARTVIDCITALPPVWGLAVADSALRAIVRPERSKPEEALERAAPILKEWRALLEARGPKRGLIRARAILDAASPLPESPGESRSRAVLLAPGLPMPLLQIPVKLGDTTAWCDFGWLIAPGRYLLGEFDGAVKYRLDGLTGIALSNKLSEEKQREDGLRRLRHRIERVVNADLSTADRRAQMVDRMVAKLPAQLLVNCVPRPGFAIAPDPLPPGRKLVRRRRR